MHSGFFHDEGGMSAREREEFELDQRRHAIESEIFHNKRLAIDAERHHACGPDGRSWAALTLEAVGDSAGKLIGRFAERLECWQRGLRPRHFGMAVARILSEHPDGESAITQFLEGFAERPR